MRKRTLLLLTLGLMSIIGDLTSFTPIYGIGLASTASPAPKVFTSVGTMEPHATRFFLEWTDLSGVEHSLEVTPEIASGIEGPYNRRNPYGAVLAAAPYLLSNPQTEAMCRSVLHRALADDSELLQELGLDSIERRGAFRIRYEPDASSSMEGLPRLVEGTHS